MDSNLPYLRGMGTVKTAAFSASSYLSGISAYLTGIGRIIHRRPRCSCRTRCSCVLRLQRFLFTELCDGASEPSSDRTDAQSWQSRTEPRKDPRFRSRPTPRYRRSRSRDEDSSEDSPEIGAKGKHPRHSRWEALAIPRFTYPRLDRQTIAPCGKAGIDLCPAKRVG
jgi:hypothetical protein